VTTKKSQDKCTVLLFNMKHTNIIILNCPHNEMKLKQNSIKTVLKQFCHCFVSVSFTKLGYDGLFLATSFCTVLKWFI